jgi:hypothetical protein
MMNRSNNQRRPRLPGGLESVPVTARRQDDIDGGPANETVRIGLGAADYEIDLSTKNAIAFRKQLAPFPSMPARRGEFSCTDRRAARPAASAAAISGPGRKTMASLSASAGVSRPAWWSNTRPRPKSLPKPATGARREPDAVPGPDSVRAVRVISQPS